MSTFPLSKRLPRRLGHTEEATVVEHLDELRSRLIVAAAAIVLSTIVAFVFQHPILRWLSGPLPNDHDKLTTFGVAEPFLTTFKISSWVGVGAATPILLWQLWGFLAPTVSERSQRTVLGFVAFAGVLLAGGVAFGYYIVLPKALSFLLHYNDHTFHVLVRASDYYNFVLLVLVAMAVVFELPIFVLALTKLGILSAHRLRHTRRIGYFIVAVVAVALPGIDPVTTTLEAIPLFALYEGSIWLAVVLERRRGRSARE